MPLRVSDGAGAWIDDFVHSDNEKFSGKSKEERINMALGAFYAAKRDKAKNNKKESHTLIVLRSLSEVGGSVSVGTASSVELPWNRRWMGPLGPQSGVPGAGGPSSSMSPGASIPGAGGSASADSAVNASFASTASTGGASSSSNSMVGSQVQPTQTGPGQLPNTITKVSPSKEDDYMGLGDRPDSLNRLYQANYGR
jgi:hypothetical protein